MTIKLQIRTAFLFLVLLFSAVTCVAATDPVDCTLGKSEILSETKVNTLYENTYTCVNNLFPKIKLSHSLSGNLEYTTLGGDCLTKTLGEKEACNFRIFYEPKKEGHRKFSLALKVGHYDVRIPEIATHTSGNVSPFITWPGRDTGVAYLDKPSVSGNKDEMDGAGTFTADAWNSSGHPVTYTYKLSVNGQVVEETTLGYFGLKAVDVRSADQDITLTITATADDANPIEGKPIVINKKESTLPIAHFVIYNNSDRPIYAVLEAGITKEDTASTIDGDNWLQALFRTTKNELAKGHFYKSDRLYHVYLNNVDEKGQLIPIKQKEYAFIDVPFYTALVKNPTPTDLNQYVMLWNGRLYLYDNAKIINERYTADKEIPAPSPTTMPPSCVEKVPAVPGFTQGCSGKLQILRVPHNAGFPLDDPYQFVEYTMGDVITKQEVNGKFEFVMPFKYDFLQANYNMSYVDGIYALPIALEPYRNLDNIGYTGSTDSAAEFSRKITDFAFKDFGGANQFQMWPTYMSTPNPPLKLPSMYVVFSSVNNTESKITDPNMVSDAVIARWEACMDNTSQDSPAFCSNVKIVNAFFLQNFENYRANCATDAKLENIEKLKHIIGFVSFPCGSRQNNNDLQHTFYGYEGLSDTEAEAKWVEAEKAYQEIQYYEHGDATKAFNPYVNLIHTQLGMTGYAYSVDDAVGFLKAYGEGLVMAIGGKEGLELGQQYDKHAAFFVSVGDNPETLWKWKTHKICGGTERSFVEGAFLHFKVNTVKVPCEITLTATRAREGEEVEEKIYRFTVEKPGPFTEEGNARVAGYISCPGDGHGGYEAFCDGINASLNKDGISTLNAPSI